MKIRNMFGKVIGGVAAVALVAVLSLTLLPTMHDGGFGFGAKDAYASVFEHSKGDHNNGGHNGEHNNSQNHNSNGHNGNNHNQNEHKNGHGGKGHFPNDHNQATDKQ